MHNIIKYWGQGIKFSPGQQITMLSDELHVFSPQTHNAMTWSIIRYNKPTSRAQSYIKFKQALVEVSLLLV